MTTTEQRSVYEIAEAIAPSWERRRERTERVAAPVRRWLVEALAPEPGQTVLELAAGVGDTGFEAAAMLGERGRLISSDFSPSMVEAARRRSAELGLENVDFRVMDAQRIELGDDSVDGVLCRYGYMLMEDPAAALAETRRVLRPGGRLALAVWGPPERNPFLSVLGGLLAQRGHLPAPDRAVPMPFDLGEPGRVEALLVAAGFRELRVEEVAVSAAFADVDDYLAYMSDTAGPIAIAARALADGDRAALKRGLEGALAAFATAEGYELPGVGIVALAS